MASGETVPETSVQGGKLSPSRGLVILIAALYVLDQAAKWWIVLNFRHPIVFTDGFSMAADRLPVITGGWGLLHLTITRVHNTGVAFGLGNGTAWSSYVFLAVPLLALAGLYALFRRGFFETKLLRVSWAFITAGILGNVTDRLVQGFFVKGSGTLSFWDRLMNGYVVDFIDVSLPWITSPDWPGGYHWPAFNVADSCICIAAAIFFIAGIASDLSKKKKKTPPVP